MASVDPAPGSAGIQSRSEPETAGILKLPADHALAAVLFLGYPVQQPTKLRRRPVESFATIDTFDGSVLI